MAEFIEREAALNADFKIPAKRLDTRIKTARDAVQAYANYIAALPAADVKPVVRGEWVDDKGNVVPWDEMNTDCPAGSCSCSVCGDWLTASDEYPARGRFCPNCGADMRGENDG